MAGNRISVQLDFTANTSQAENALKSLQTSLNNISRMSSFNTDNVGMQKSILEASEAAIQLRQNLQSAMDVNTGKLNLSKLNQEMDKSGMSLQKYATSLAAIGPEGRQAFMQLTNAIVASETPLKQSNMLVDKLWDTLKRTAGWQLSSSMIHGFMSGVQTAYNYAQDLNRSLNDIRIVTGYSADKMADFAQQANKAAKALSTTTTDYTNASLIYFQQGLNDQEVKERTDVTVKMANVTQTSAEQVSQQMTAVWNNFDDGSKSLEYYADVMTALGAATASSTDEIAEGLEKFAAVADTVGLSYEYATAALATVTATTRQSASVVGTAFKTLFARIEGLKLGDTLDDGTTLNKYSEALANVGVNIKDASGEMKQMDTILNETANVWSTLTKDQQVALAQTVAGVRQYTQFIALMDNWDFMEENLETVAGAEGELQKQADIYAESWEAAQKRVQAAAEAIYSDLLDDRFFIGITNLFGGFLDTLDKVIDRLGGLGTILPGLVLLIDKMFGQKIQIGITKMGERLSTMTAAGRQRRADADAAVKQSAIKSTEEIMKSTTSSGYERDVMVEEYKRITDLQNTYVKNAEKMSDTEKTITQMYLQRQQALAEENIAQAKKVDLLQKQQKELRYQAENDLVNFNEEEFLKTARSQQGAKNNRYSAGIVSIANKIEANGNNTLTALQNDAGMQNIFKQLGLDIDELGRKYQNLGDIVSDINGKMISELQDLSIVEKEALSGRAITDSINETNFASTKNEIQAVINTIKEAGPDGAKAAKELETAFKQIDFSKSFSENSAAIKNFNQVFQDVAKNARIKAKTIEEALKSLGLPPERLQAIKQGAQLTGAELEKLKQHVLNSSSGFDVASAKIKSFQSAISATASKISNWAQGLSSAAMSVSMLKNTIDTLNNPDATAWEKWSTVLMSLGMTIPLVSNAVKTFAESTLVANGIQATANALTQTRIASLSAETVAETVSKVAKEGSVAATVQDTVATKIHTAIQALSAAGEKDLTAARILETLTLEENEVELAKDTVETIVNTTAKNAAKLATLGWAAAIGILAIAIGAGVVALINMNDETKKNEELNKKVQENYDRQIKSIDNVVNHSKEIVSEYEKMTEALNKYEKSSSALDTLDSKTVEYKNTLQETNKAAQELIDTLGLTYGNGYTIENGRIIVDTSSSEYVEGINAQDQAAEIARNLMKTEDFAKKIVQYEADTSGTTKIPAKYVSYEEEGEPDFTEQAFTSPTAKLFELLRRQFVRDESSNEHLHDDKIRDATYAGQEFYNYLINGYQAALKKGFNGDIKDYFKENFDTIKNDWSDLFAELTLDEDYYDFMDGVVDTAQRIYDAQELVSGTGFQDYLLNSFIEKNPGIASYLSGTDVGSLIEDSGLDLTTIMSEAFDLVSNPDKVQEMIDKMYPNGYEFTEEQKKMIEENAAAEQKILQEVALQGAIAEITSKYADKLTPAARSKAKENITANYVETTGSNVNDITSFEMPDPTRSNKVTEYSAGDLSYAQWQDQDIMNGFVQSEIDRGMDPQAVWDYAAAMKEASMSAEDWETKMRNIQSILNEGIAQGLDGAEIEHYADYLQSIALKTDDLADSLIANDEAATALARSILRMNKGIAALNENWKTWKGYLADVNDLSIEGYDAMQGVKTAVADLLDVSTDMISDDFIRENLELIERAANNDAEAIDTLGDKMANLSANNLVKIAVKAELEEEDFLNQLSNFRAFLDTLEPGEYVSYADLDDTSFIDSLNAMLAAGVITKDQLNAQLAGIHMEAHYKTEPVDLGTQTVEQYDYVPSVSNAGPVVNLDSEGNSTFQPKKISYRVKKVGSETVQTTGMAAAMTTGEGTPVIDGITKTGGSGKSNFGSLPKGKTGGSGRSGGGGGGGSKQKKKDLTKRDDVVERYHRIEDTVDNLTKQYDKLSNATEHAFGTKKLKLMDQQIAKLKQMAKSQKDYLSEIEKYLAQDKNAVINIGAQIDTDGVITNYDQIAEGWLKRINDLENAYNAGSIDDDTFEERKKAIDEEKKILEQYEETYDKWLEKQDELAEAMAKIIQKELDQIQVKVDLTISETELSSTINDYMKEKLTDRHSALSAGLDTIMTDMADMKKQFDADEEAINKILLNAKEEGRITAEQYNAYMSAIQKGAWDTAAAILESSNLTQEEISAMTDYATDMMEIVTHYHELREDLINLFNDGMASNNKFVQQNMEAFEQFGGIISHYVNVIDLLGKKLPDGKELRANMLDMQMSNSKDELEMRRNIYEEDAREYTLLQESLQKRRAEIESSGNQTALAAFDRMAEEELALARETLAQAEEDYLSSWEETLEAAQEKFENMLDNIVDEFAKSVAGMSFESLNDKLERVQDAQRDRYVADYKAIYEINKLNRDLQKSMDETTNIAAKSKLKALQNDINKEAGDYSKLTEHDLEYLQKQYEIQKAKIALEEAQNAKNTVRLRRDNEGNWGYVYTADEDNVSKAQEDYEKALTDMAENQDAYLDEMSKKWFETEQEFIEKYREVASDATLTDQEREEKLAELQAFYTEKLSFIRGELEKNVDRNVELYNTDYQALYDSVGKMTQEHVDLQTSFEQTIVGIVQNNVTGFNQLYSNAKEAIQKVSTDTKTALTILNTDIDNAMKAANTSVNTFSKQTDKDLGIMKTAAKDAKKATEDLIKEIKEDYSPQNIANFTTALATWAEQFGDLDEKASRFASSLRSLYQAMANSKVTWSDKIDYNDKMQDLLRSTNGSALGNYEYMSYAAARRQKVIDKGGNAEEADAFQEVLNQYGKLLQSGTIDANEKLAFETYLDEDRLKKADQATKNLIYQILRDKYHLTLMAFASGGLATQTGPAWLDGTRNRPELVLNPDDTKNFLIATEMLREIMSQLNFQANWMSMGATGLAAAIPTTDTSQTLQQQVSIEATFPNVQDRNEIEEAFNNIINAASQYANRKD